MLQILWDFKEVPLVDFFGRDLKLLAPEQGLWICSAQLGCTGSVLILEKKAFDRKGREGPAKVANKSAIEIRTLPLYGTRET